jgi:hypothetical protein
MPGLREVPKQALHLVQGQGGQDNLRVDLFASKPQYGRVCDVSRSQRLETYPHISDQ